MCIRPFLLTALGLSLPLCIFSQTYTSFSSPSVSGSAPHKAMILDYGFRSPTKITSSSNLSGVGNSTGFLDDQKQFNLKLRAPIWLKPGLKVLLGFQYKRQSFSVEGLSNPEYLFYSNVQSRELRTIGGSLTVLKPTRGKRWHLFRGKLQLSGDYAGEFRKDPLNQFMKASVSTIVGWKEHANLSWGIGASYSYTFGRHTIFPILHYHQTFSRKWGIEATLPSKLEIRYTLNPKTFLYAGAGLQGANYQLYIEDENKAGGSLKEYRWTELRAGIRLEREIHDWLWMGASVGYRSSLEMNLSDPFSTGGGNVIQSRPGSGLYASFSIYLVLPQKYRKKGY